MDSLRSIPKLPNIKMKWNLVKMSERERGTHIQIVEFIIITSTYFRW